MAKPNIDFDPVTDTFTFEVGRISGAGTVDVDEGTFTITEAVVNLPSGETHALPHTDHFIDLPIPPPVLDFILI